MSILDALGAVPSNFTVPFTVAAVAGSMGVAAGAAASVGVLLDCSVFSFLLQAAVVSNAHSAIKLTVVLAQAVFLFTMSAFHLGV
jgi:hypothetical protein